MNIFPQVPLSDEVYVAATHLTAETRQWLTNRLYEVSQQKLLLTYNPAEPTSFIQAEAELQGRIRELMSILEAEELATAPLSEDE